MKKKCRVEFLPSAFADVNAALDYFLEKDLSAASTFYQDIERATNQLESFPLSAPFSKDQRLASEGYRVIQIEYEDLLFYRIHDEVIYVYRIISGKRNYGAFI